MSGEAAADRVARAILRKRAKALACPGGFFNFAWREDCGERKRVAASAAQLAALLFAASYPQACVRMPEGSGRSSILASLALWSAGSEPEGSGVIVGPSREEAESATRQAWEALGGAEARPRGEVRLVFPELLRGRDDEPWGPGAWTVRRKEGSASREPTCRAVDGRRADLARARTLAWFLVDDFAEKDREGWLEARKWFARHVASKTEVAMHRARVLVLGGDASPDDLVGALEHAGWPTLSLRSDGVASVSAAPGFDAEAHGLVRTGSGILVRNEHGAWRGKNTAVPAGLVEDASPEKEAATAAGKLADFAERYRDDFLGFVRLLEVRPREAVGVGRVPFEPTAIQLAYCRARTPRDVVLKPRQVKVTTIELARDLWFFLTKPGVAVRVLCQSSKDEEMLTELSERVVVFLDALRKNAGLDLSAVFTRETRTEWALPNGSTLRLAGAGASEAAAQKKGRGGTVHRLHATEIASWEWAGQTLNAVLESIAGPEHGTEIVFESTANGTGSGEGVTSLEASGAEYFFNACQGARAGTNGLAFHFFPWMLEREYATALDPMTESKPAEVFDPEDQPDPEKRERERNLLEAGASAEQLKWWRAKARGKSLEEMDQEFPHDPDLCFLVSGRQFFDKAKVESYVLGAQEPIDVREIRRSGAFGEIRIWQRPRPGKKYVVSGDPSEGTGKDRGVATVWERGTGKHCATLAGQFKPAELAREMMKLGFEYGTALLAVERNNHGHAVLAELEREDRPGAGEKKKYPRIFRDHDHAVGWISSDVSRSEALFDLDRAIRDGDWTTPDAELGREMRTFVVGKRGKAEARKGCRDDLVLSSAIAHDVLRRKGGDDGGRPKAPKPIMIHHDSVGIG